MDVRIPAALALLSVGAAGAYASDRMRAAPRTAGGPAAALGGFAALAAQAVWVRADRAILERDEDRAVVLLRTLVDLEPQVVSAARQAATEIGWNMVQGREDPAVRWSLAREAVRILTDCVGRNPGSADALRYRADYLSRFLASDAALTARYAAAVDARGPLAAARDDYEAALGLAPDDPEAAGGLAFVAGRLATAAADEGRWPDAAADLRRALRGLDAVLADVREAAREGTLGPDDVARLEATRAGADALLRVAEADDAGRGELLDRFRREHPGVLR